MIRAVFPGSFDPPTNGHLNVIERALDLFEEILIVIAVNSQKKALFSPEERLEMMKKLLSTHSNVSVHLYDGLVVNFAKEHGAKVLLRGIRGLTDFSYEFDLSILNKGLNPKIETLFIATDPKYFVIRSSAIKDLVAFNGDVSHMVPPIVEKALREKIPMDMSMVKK